MSPGRKNLLLVGLLLIALGVNAQSPKVENAKQMNSKFGRRKNHMTGWAKEQKVDHGQHAIPLPGQKLHFQKETELEAIPLLEYEYDIARHWPRHNDVLEPSEQVERSRAEFQQAEAQHVLSESEGLQQGQMEQRRHLQQAPPSVNRTMVMVLGMTLRVLTEPAVQDAWRIRFIQAIMVFTFQNVTLDSVATYDAKGPDMPISVATTFTISFEPFTTQDAANLKAAANLEICLPSTSTYIPSPFPAPPSVNRTMVMVLGMTLRVLTEPAAQDAWRIRFIQAITVFTRQNVTLDSIATHEARGPDMPISVATTFTITFEPFTTQAAANLEMLCVGAL
eukprot:gene12512-15725_t